MTRLYGNRFSRAASATPRFTPQRIRSARSELAEQKRLVLVEGEFHSTPFGRKAQVWSLPELHHAEPERTPDRSPFKSHGDPTLGGDGLRIAIDANCLFCGWPERFYDTLTPDFGCIKCGRTSDERNA